MNEKKNDKVTLAEFKYETKRKRYLNRKTHQERKLEQRRLRKAQWKSKTR